MSNKPGLLAFALTTAALGGCAVGPDYHQPAVEMPAAFKEAGNWKPAEPKEQMSKGPWWEIYNDPQLNALVSQVEISNQNVRVAEAQYRQAQALLGAARAAYYPTLGAGLSATRGTAAVGTAGSANIDRLSLSASWEADVWGGIRRKVESGRATAEASAGDLGAALLSAQATLVQAYLQLRVSDAQKQLLDRNVVAYQRSLEITRNRYEAGVASRLDVTQAEAQLKSTQAQAIDLGVARAQLEHAIAILIGKPPSELNIAVASVLPTLPDIPAAIPSTLLERRPDIAGAERRVAAANAEIGVAQAAFFPSLMLSGIGGFQNSSFANLLTLPNRFWSLGPALALTLFDAGARSAQKEQAVAAYDQSVATYRQTVLGAFQDVEDNLAALRILAEEAEVQEQATKAAADSLVQASNQYKAGTVSYLNVVTAEATFLAADSSKLNVTGRRLLASVALLKALGGDWPIVRPQQRPS
jgi:NodT family efflux transporter outer membrane factor (OMF) lipoprotein